MKTLVRINSSLMTLSLKEPLLIGTIWLIMIFIGCPHCPSGNDPHRTKLGLHALLLPSAPVYHLAPVPLQASHLTISVCCSCALGVYNGKNETNAEMQRI